MPNKWLKTTKYSVLILFISIYLGNSIVTSESQIHQMWQNDQIWWIFSITEYK